MTDGPAGEGGRGFVDDARTSPDSRRRRTVLIGTAAAAAVIGTASVPALRTDGGTVSRTERPLPEPTTDPDLIAHRGFAGENPENTLAAVETATREDGPGRRTDAVEVDVVPTADGDVVVFHDDDLAGRAGEGMGLTDTAGFVWETDTDTVTSAEVLRSGETVPRLEDLLGAVPSDVGVNVELKNPGTASLRVGEKLGDAALDARKRIWRPFVERVLDVVDGHGHEVLFSSFCEAPLAVVSEQSTAPVAPLVGESITDAVAVARAYDADAIHPPVAAVRGTPFFDETRFGDTDLVRTARDHRWAVNAWTVDSWYQAERLLAAGVDGIIADHSTLLSENSSDQ